MKKNKILEVNVYDKKIFKKVKKLIKYCDKNNLKIKFNIINNDDKVLVRDIKTIEKAINIKDKKERYTYIYDIICSYLDERLKEGYCEFIDDMCIRDRLKNNNHKNGCCECNGRGKCKYLIDSTCTMKSCMACKIFTCKTLRKKGIKHSINDYALSVFFDRKEKYILENSFWTPKDIVIERLLKKEYISSWR